MAFERADISLHRLRGYTTMKQPGSETVVPNPQMQQLFVFQGVTQTAVELLFAITEAVGAENLSRLAIDASVVGTFNMAKLAWQFIAGKIMSSQQNFCLNTHNVVRIS